MAYLRTEIALVVLLALTVLCTEETAAQSSCSNVLITMSPCLSYISGNSSNPSSQCCSQVANVIRLSPQCLCEVLNGSSSSIGAGGVDPTQALRLPDACNVQTPSISRCNGEGRGSKTFPTSQEHVSSHGSSNIKQQDSILILFLSASSFVSLFITL